MNDSMGSQTNSAAVRGVVLVIIAIVVGVLLLRSSDDGGLVATQGGAAAEPGVTTPLPSSTTAAPTDSTTAAPSDTTAPAATDATTDTSAAPSDTSEAGSVSTIADFVPRPPAEVTVQVANTTSTKGAAGGLTDQLKTLNYITATPTNMRGTPLPKTRVHYQPGSLLEAQAVAEVLGLDPKNDVFQMFQDTSAIDQWDDPEVFIALGDDLAAG
jgi:hypothetical protein